MNRAPQLPAYQEILLLALDDKKGTTGTGSMFLHAIAGAVLAELAGSGAVKISADKKKAVTAVSGRAPADPLLAECWQMIKSAKKPKKASEWVMKFAGIKDLKNRVARSLVAAGVLEEETGSVLKIFRRTVYPATDPGPEHDLKERMRKAIFTGTEQVEIRTVIVIALASAARMLETVFAKKDLKERKLRLEKLCSGQVAGAATKEAVEAVQAAILVATMVPIVVAAGTR